VALSSNSYASTVCFQAISLTSPCSLFPHLQPARFHRRQQRHALANRVGGDASGNRF
jgi:hypothetical protein